MKQTITSALLVITLLFLSQSIMSQVSSLPFNQAVNGYSEISGGTVLINTNTWDDETFSAVPIGFSFTFNLSR